MQSYFLSLRDPREEFPEPRTPPPPRFPHFPKTVSLNLPRSKSIGRLCYDINSRHSHTDDGKYISHKAIQVVCVPLWRMSGAWWCIDVVLEFPIGCGQIIVYNDLVVSPWGAGVFHLEVSLLQSLLHAVLSLCASSAKPSFQSRHRRRGDEDVAGGYVGLLDLLDALSTWLARRGSPATECSGMCAPPSRYPARPACPSWSAPRWSSCSYRSDSRRTWRARQSHLAR